MSDADVRLLQIQRRRFFVTFYTVANTLSLLSHSFSQTELFQSFAFFVVLFEQRSAPGHPRVVSALFSLMSLF